MKKAIVCLLLCSVLVACASPDTAETPESTASASVTESITEAVTEEIEIDVISPLATADLMLPLDDFSWKREYPTEYVMLHFSSNVRDDRVDPYDLAAVRAIFEETEVSTNYIIDREGNIFCYIPEQRCAWHAGKGEFAGDERLTDKMNRYSIGIELLAIGSESDMAQFLSSWEYSQLAPELPGFTDAQYEALDRLITDICDRNSIPRDRGHIIGHDEYSETKTDPGELFDWSRILPEG